MLSVTLDGQIYDQALGLDELNDRVFYNSELSMYLNQLDGDVVFINDGYNYLKGQFDTDVCSIIDVEILDDVSGITYNGVIFLNDVKWNLSRREAECKIVSDRFIETINNNKGIKVQIGVALSKDFVPITSVFTDITCPDPTGTLDVTRRGYRIFDVFNELVQFMTNGEMTFVSDYFDHANGGEAAYSVIVRGQELRLGAAELTPYISFMDFFNDINKLHNLAGVIEGNTLRIEPKAYFRELGTSTTIENVNDLSQESNRQQFYASIKMGSAQVASGYGYLIKLSYNGFQKEQFFLSGQCNIDTELDLQLQTLITDTNIIQDMQPVANGGTDNDDYDNDIVIIHCNSTDTAAVTISPLSPDYFYNEYFTNRYASERWSETFPFSIVQLLNTEQRLVLATLTSTQTINTNPSVGFFSPDNDSTFPNFDINGDYQIGVIPVWPSGGSVNTGYFEAPIDMVASIGVDFYLTGAYHLTKMFHVDSSGALMSTPVDIDVNPNITFNQLFSYFNMRHVFGSSTFYMPAGTRVYVKLAINGIINYGGRLEVVQTGAYGGIYKVINNNNAFISRTRFEYPIDASTWNDIRNSPFKRIDCTFVDGSFSGFPIDITRNIVTGASDVQLYQRKQDIDG